MARSETPPDPSTRLEPLAVGEVVLAPQPVEIRRESGREPLAGVDDLPLGSPERRIAHTPPSIEAPATPSAVATISEFAPTAEVAPISEFDAEFEPEFEPEPERPVASVGPVEVIERVPTPGFAVLQTVWHPSPSRRVVVVEMGDGSSARLSEGERIAGYTVGKIGLASVEFLRGGVVVEKRVGKR